MTFCHFSLSSGIHEISAEDTEEVVQLLKLVPPARQSHSGAVPVAEAREATEESDLAEEQEVDLMVAAATEVD